VSAFSNHRDPHPAERRRQFVESLSGMPLADRNFAHVERCALAGNFGFTIWVMK
jgi:hypothetical protein